jgi:hypothetical protein
MTFYLWQRERNPLTIAAFTGQSAKQSLPQRGARLQTLELMNDKGEKLQLSFGSAELPTLVYVLSPACKWCRANQAKVNRLAKRLEGRYHVFGLSTLPREEWDGCAESGYVFPIYFMNPHSTTSSIPLDFTPETLVFSRDGILDRAWAGAYMNDNGRQIASFFGVDPFQ